MRKSLVAVAPVGLLMLLGCGGSPDQKTAAAPPQPATAEVFVAQDAKGVQTITVEVRTIPNYLEIPARIVADPTHVVHVFPATGGRVIEMKVRPWDRVHQGQTLALLESRDVSRAMADYRKARVDAQMKKKTLDRTENILAHHAIADKDSEEAEADALSAEDEEKTTSRTTAYCSGVDPATDSDQLQISRLPGME